MWFHRAIVETGRLPLFCLFASMLLAFGFIRFSVRMIRAQVKWWPGNVTPGGMHIHHVVFGVVFMLVGGVFGFALPDRADVPQCIAASLFGIGSALVLDEFALVLHLRDVYWSEQGRTSIDAIFVAVAMIGLLLLGFHPLDIGTSQGGGWVGVAITALFDLILVAIVLLKGKIWTGLLGIFVPLLLLLGAWRVARPHSPWARWRYREARHRGAAKLERAFRREERYRRPLIHAKIWVQEFLSGRHDAPPPPGH
jgi:hypothetical protein